ncbi:MAG: glycosyl transferase, group 1 [Marmoricola sp.]|nr:glycosyl transferase, group 1 [Marmoricola sp.]
MSDTPAVWHGLRRELGGRRAVRMLLSAALAVGLIVVVLPRVVSATFGDVLTSLQLVTLPESIGLTVLWAVGLLTYSVVLVAALEGLSHRRALTLNLTGSAVSNVLPFGGAAGVSLNFLMIRSWGFSAQGFSAFAVVTNVWGILSKLALPAVALVALVATGGPVGSTLRWSALGAAAVLVLVLVVCAGVLARDDVAARVVPPLARLFAACSRLVRRPADAEVATAHLMEFRDRVVDVVGRRWAQLTVGQIGYSVMQAVLLWACLQAVGADLSPVVVLAAYAVDRVLSMVVLTPGGTGFAEAGSAAALVALGGAPAATAAAVLLYRGFTFALEIPVGGIWTAAWFWRRRRAQRAAAAAEPAPRTALEEVPGR